MKDLNSFFDHIEKCSDGIIGNQDKERVLSLRGKTNPEIVLAVIQSITINVINNLVLVPKIKDVPMHVDPTLTNFGSSAGVAAVLFGMIIPIVTGDPLNVLLVN